MSSGSKTFWFLQWERDGDWIPSYLDYWDGVGKLQVATEEDVALEMLAQAITDYPNINFRLVKQLATEVYQHD